MLQILSTEPTPNFYDIPNTWKLIGIWPMLGDVCGCPRKKACTSPGKHPIHPWQTKPTPPSMGDNVAVITGAVSGITVVDCDGQEGIETLNALIAKHGPLPGTAISITGSGGMHIFFRYTPALKTRSHCLPKIDVRNDGGIAVVPPSLHHSGNYYRWSLSPTEQELAEMPTWLIDALLGSKEIATHRDAYKNWLTIQAPCVSGSNGSGQMMRVARMAVRQYNFRDYADWRIVVDDYNRRCTPPWSERELQHKFESALKSQQQDAAVAMPMENNKPKISEAWLLQVLTEDPKFVDRIRTDALTGVITIDGDSASNGKMLQLRTEIRERYELQSLPKAWVFDAVEEVAKSNTHNPIVDYLRSLRWDQTSRIDTIGSLYFNSTFDHLDTTMVRKFLISAVARAFTPGCDVHSMLIFHGPQGCGKSSFFRILGGPFYTDTPINLQQANQALDQISGRWLIEMAELESLRRARDSEQIKAFISSNADNYRPAYERHRIIRPRCCVFGGTTNHDNILQDSTGSRRFWIVNAPNRCDTDYITKWRDQIWAEAVQLYLSGYSWWLTGPEDRERQSKTEEFVAEDPAVNKVAMWIPGKTGTYTLDQIREQAGIEKLFVNQQHAIADVLRENGWVQTRRTIGGKKLRFWCFGSGPQDHSTAGTT